MTHSPAPWTVDNDLNVRDAKGRRIAETHGAQNLRANAAILAAAPELAKALAQWEIYGTNNGGEENYSFLAETRAALRKAGLL